MIMLFYILVPNNINSNRGAQSRTSKRLSHKKQFKFGSNLPDSHNDPGASALNQKPGRTVNGLHTRL
ncbi:hypothetical protein XENTR_v10014258 [Xenopus tropicalis]|nr:hypothetical protein XENTR_v10014258 [Xenopus tropicalis]